MFPGQSGLVVGLFDHRLPLNPRSACLGLPNTAIRACRTTLDFLVLCKEENVFSVSGSGQGGYRERMYDLEVSPSFIALPHPQAFNQELVHR